MIYTNDEADKSIRQRNFYLTVYAMPVALAGVICLVVYWASANHYLGQLDTRYGYIMSLSPALFLYTFNKNKWLKMPDGTFHNIKGISPTPKLNLNEPAVYEAEFFYSKTNKAGITLVGVLVVGASIWLGLKKSESILTPIITNLFGLFLIYQGLKGLLDKNAQLKIAKNGLWTKYLGFVHWDDIHFAEVVEDKTGDSPQLVLEIRLKGTKFEQTSKPDESLLLSALKDKEMIELVINKSIIEFNESKRLAGE